MPAEFPLPPAQRAYRQPVFRRNSLLSLSFGRTIDRERLREAWRTLVRVHPALRSSLHQSNLLEHELGGEDFPGWEEPDWSGKEPESIPALWEELQKNAAAEFFEQNAYPLWRVYLIKLPGGQSHLLVAFHPGLIDRESASTLLIQWLNALEADPSVLSELPTLPGLAVANASIDLGEPSTPIWPDEWRDDCKLEILRPWFWLQPNLNEDSQAARQATITFQQSISPSLIDAIHAKAHALNVAPQVILSLLWAGFWAMRSEVGGAFVCHPFDLSNHLAPEHHDILGRLSPLAPLCIRVTPPVGKDWPLEWWTEQLHGIQASGCFAFAQPPPDLDEIILGAGLPLNEPYPGSAAFWSAESINDLLHSQLPRWLAADARWTELPPLPLCLYLEGGRHPELRIIAHPDHLDQKTCQSLAEQFLLTSATALDVRDAAFRPSSDLGKHAASGSLFALSSDPAISQRLTEALGANSEAIILSMGESTMTGADLLGCSNQLARYLRRNKLPEGHRYLVNLIPGNWLSLLLLTLVREGIPFLICEEPIPADQPAAWFKNEKIACVFLDSTTAAAWEDHEIKKIVLDSAWEKVAAMSDSPLQIKKAQGPVIWEFGSVQEERRLRFGEALLGSSLAAAAEFWGLENSSRLLSTASPGSPAWLEETLLASLTGSTLVHPSQDIFATRSAFQEALQEYKITHLCLPAIRWSDWVHFLAELRQGLPLDLQRVLIRSGRLGVKAVREWLRISEGKVRTSVVSSPFGLAAPGIGTDLDENLLPILSRGLIPLGRPIGDLEVFAKSKDGNRLPAEVVGRLHIGLPANAVVDGILANEHALSLRGIVQENGFVSSLSQPDVSSEILWRPPGPIVAAAENALLKRPEFFDAIVTRINSQHSKNSHQLQAWIIPQESGAALPHGLAIWWKNESNCAWTLEAAAAIPKCPIRSDGTLAADALPAPAPLTFKPAPSPSPNRTDQFQGNTAAQENPNPPAWEIRWIEPKPDNATSLILCGDFPFANLAASLLKTVASMEASFALATASIPKQGQKPSAEGSIICMASSAGCWELLRWANSLNTEQQQQIQILLVEPSLAETSTGLDTKLKLLWSKMLGKANAGNSRRDSVKGIRPVRCHLAIKVLCENEPVTLLSNYLPAAEFYAGDLTSSETMASAILDVLTEEEPETTSSPDQ